MNDETIRMIINMEIDRILSRESLRNHRFEHTVQIRPYLHVRVHIGTETGIGYHVFPVSGPDRSVSWVATRAQLLSDLLSRYRRARNRSTRPPVNLRVLHTATKKRSRK